MKLKIIFLISLLILTGCSTQDLVYDGLVLFAPQSGQTIYLIDSEENIIHSWDTGKDSPYGQLLNDGTLLYIATKKAIPTDKVNEGVIREVDWENNILWEYTDLNIHHDFAKLPNGNILAIQWEIMSEENLERVQLKDPPEVLWSDKIIEIDYITKEIVWELSLQDELNIEDYKIKSDENNIEWTHTNAVEYLEEGNPFNGKESILISSRTLNHIFIIDKESKEVVWEYNEGLLRQHNPNLLTNGNILVFNNGLKASQVLEINPTNNQVVWTYESADFFSHYISSAQRLSNGNTLICEGSSGTIFEVTNTKEIVWEYNANSQSVFRAYKYSADYTDWPFEIS
ncbi:PQQ-binding-like beta-propeller repeat protein [archaeon]|jgi:hypothetical protein|nr:PQQ-binding-like beta-propeller repeat protein [archaeon]MBT3450648.1 PQQ-binding-like beta-propeller repeat protein [archaeon]MBT6868772.1 PQQ-binding-like beta-propeller repeat protein [archaeon]MBT7193007.1 PQQ-binding-like beta-propeller repeat protein [archaeon]MBT7380973.1 PQQ-binding-like beta-propeller repeat protein [archaeon]